MELIKLTPENLEKEHICCAISSNKDCQVTSKKAWLFQRMQEGLVFLKANARGKCFIEYLPAEYAWAPVEAPNYMYIDCLWVSGKFKGQGISNQLLEACMQDSRQKGKSGLVILSSEKKRSFLSDKKFLLHKGFQVADNAEPYFELMYLPFAENAPVPKIKENARNAQISQKGFVLYYTSQCPFTAKYVPLIEQSAKEKNLPFTSIHIEDCSEAQSMPILFTTYALFYNGEFITHEILSVKKFENLAEELIGCKTEEL